ncbi:unnamed protein product [Paramecium primaurelia]|uniref:Myb-like domain-containing protein n=1 Tax=Paramecium primaurelia TaxID=5886 RepID=A0A8S1JQY1_PARPR|nr:unnamed protein product [Paramecium primaurelia]
MFPFAYIPQDSQSSFNFCQPSYTYQWYNPYYQYGNFIPNYLSDFQRINCYYQQPQIHNQLSINQMTQIQEKCSETLHRSLQNEQIETPTTFDNHQFAISKKPETIIILNKKKKKKSKKSKSFKKGHWTNKEHRLYEQFILNHKDIMSDSDQKKMKQIFKKMSDFIKSRSASQCRSHHQKFDPKKQQIIVAGKNSNQFKIANE